MTTEENKLDQNENNQSPKKYKKTKNDPIYKQKLYASEEIQRQQQAHYNQIFGVTTLLDIDGITQIQGRLVDVPADGNCGFAALGLTRQKFMFDLINYLNMWNLQDQGLVQHDPMVALLMTAMGGHTLQQFLFNLGHDGYWMDQHLFAMAAYLYNIRLEFYFLNHDSRDKFHATSCSHLYPL